MDQTKESIVQRVEDAIAKGGLEVLSYMHDALNTIEDWLKGGKDAEKGTEGQAAVDAAPVAATTNDTPAA